MRLFRKSDALDLPVAMSGVKLGNRLLVVGCSDPMLIARLAARVGLTGRACAVDEMPERVAAAARITEREGALLEAAVSPAFTLPYEAGSFDIVVLRNMLSLGPNVDKRPHVVSEAHRVLRSGGRCLVVEGGARSAIAALIGAAEVRDQSIGATALLQGAGFVAVRALAERDGMLFAEGVKKNTW